jgi:hypothetical protein
MKSQINFNKLPLIFLFLFFCPLVLLSINNPVEIKKGMVLVYQFENNNQKNDFIVTVEDFKTTLTFSFKMTNQKRTSGKISLSKEALKNAIAQYNYFQSNDVALDNQTSIWVSKKVWKNIKKKKKCFISTNSGELSLKELEFVNNQNYPLQMNGNDSILNVMYCITKDSNAYKYWILDDPNNPLILKMELNFSIELIEIKYLN